MYHRDLYYNDEPEISDDEFDALVDELTRIDPNDPAITMVGAELRPSEWKKVKHNIPMGSLNKVNPPKDMLNWIAKTVENADDLFWTEKLDGLSIELIYDNGNLIHALTRGAGEGDGEDIVSNVVKMGGVKKRLPFSGSLRGEIMLFRDKHEEFFPEKANPRNAAAGVSRRLDGEGCQHLNVYFYQAIGKPTNGQKITSDFEQYEFISKELGLDTPAFGVISGSADTKFEKLLKIWQTYQEKTRDSLNYEIDGLVCGVNSLRVQDELGETNGRPKGKIAWKFANQMVETTITGVAWTTKKAGRISPTVHIEPTQILGSTVSKATVYNFDYIEKLGLGIGARVLMCKAGEIIPRIQSVVKKPKSVFEIPTQCPECNGKVEKQNVYLVCVSAGCIGKKTGIINSWIKNIGVMEWGPALIDKLIEAGLVDSIVDLYRLNEQDLLTIERMGDTSACKAINELWKVKEIPLHTFIGSLGILNVGRTTIEIAIENGKDTLDKLFNTTEAQFAGMKGIGEVKAKALCQGLKDNADLIDQIMEAGVKIAKVKKPEAPKSGKLNGMRICITGKTDKKRDEWARIIAENGGIFEKSVKSDTTFLVIVDPDSTTTKANAARANGTKLIDEGTLAKMVDV